VSAMPAQIAAEIGWAIACKMQESRLPCQPQRSGEANGCPYLDVFPGGVYGAARVLLAMGFEILNIRGRR
jgi:hypothetical protein